MDTPLIKQGEELKLTFDQNGGIAIEALGFTGTRCAEATKVFENAVVGGSRSDEKKPEYYEPEAGESVHQTANARF